MKAFLLLLSLFLLPLAADEPYTIKNPSYHQEEVRDHQEGVRDYQEEVRDHQPLPDSFLLEFRTAYFYPTNRHFRNFYSGGPIWGLQFDWKVSDQVYLWTSAEYFFKKGETSLLNPTKLTLVPLALGVKWLYSSYHWLQPYLGTGLETIYLRETTSSSLLLHSVHNWDFGFRFKVGFLTQFCENFFIDVYSDFFMKCARFYKTSTNLVKVTNPVVNYFNFGGAVGFSF